MRNVTLFNVLVVLVALTVFALFVGNCSSGILGWDQQAAEKEAHLFQQKMNLSGQVECARLDSDGDGYVSCTLATKHGNETELIALECARKFTWNSGCRMQKLSNTRNGR